jgi:hypothetical protein
MARTEPQTEQTEQEQLAAQAVRELKALTKVPGALKVITAETAASAYLVAEGAVARRSPQHPHRRTLVGAARDGVLTGLTAAQRARYAELAAPPETAPAHFVCHDVVRIEGPDDRGRYTAHTAEGDTCTGYPAALLRRLRQASTER